MNAPINLLRLPWSRRIGPPLVAIVAALFAAIM